MSDTKTKQVGGSSLILRSIALFVAIFFTASLVLLVYHQFHIRSDDPVPLIVERIFGCVSGLVEATVASFCWWYGLRGHLRTQTRTGQVASVVGFSLLGGVIIGGIGFALGFFGPIIATPDSPQGPLLGIFITGPLGFVVGVIAGFVYGLIRSLKQKPQQAQPNTALEPTPTAPPVLPKP